MEDRDRSRQHQLQRQPATGGEAIGNERLLESIGRLRVVNLPGTKHVLRLMSIQNCADRTILLLFARS